MQRAFGATLTILEVAAPLAGIPLLGTAASLAQEIARTCDNIGLHKRQSRRLANKCCHLLTTLEEQSPRLVGSDLIQEIDHVTYVLERILRRVRQYSQYNAVKCFLRSSDIEEGLTSSEFEIEAAFSKFQLTAQIANHQLQREQSDTLLHYSAEVRECLGKILTSQSELKAIVDMQNAGERVAEPIMEAGQIEMRQLRDARTEQSGTSLNAPASNENEVYLQFQRGLMDLHRKTGVLPTVKVLDGEVIREGEAAIAGGTYSDIWIGKWLGEETVALKALRGIRTSIPQAQKRFVHEITVWSELKNDHILPFYGILTDQGPHIYMVSPWQENGNVLDYVRSREGANKIHLLAGAAKGVEYLHGSSITHGNIKCTNILVSQNGEARMCDFGMSKIIEEVTEVTASATLTASGSARWLAPELIEGVVSSPTKAADAYSYAMACLELLTGKYPFAHCKRDAAVIHDIVVLKRTPRRPEGQCVTDDMWAMMQRCWRSDSSARPSMGDIARQIQMFDDTTPPDL